MVLLTLADARTALGVGPDPARDPDLEFYISAVTPVIEDIVGPIDPRPVTEWHDGGAPEIVLQTTPVLSVTSVVAAGSTVDPGDYTVEDNVLTRRGPGGALGAFPGGTRDVLVTYQAGRSTVPANVKLAARRLLRHLWQQEQQGFRPSLGAPEAITPSGFAVPNAVLQLCASEVQPSGFA